MPVPRPAENSDSLTPVSTEGTSPRKEYPPQIAQMFTKIHDWEAIFLAFRSWLAAARGTDKAFALSIGIPYGSLARHASEFRRRMAEEHAQKDTGTEVPTANGLKAAPFSSLPTPSTLASRTDAPVTGLGSGGGRGGVRLLEAASPAPDLFTKDAKAREKGFRGAIALLRQRAPGMAEQLLGWMDSGNPAAVAAIKEGFALLREAEKEQPAVSPFEGMDWEEIKLNVLELFGTVESERPVVLDLKKGSGSIHQTPG